MARWGATKMPGLPLSRTCRTPPRSTSCTRPSAGSQICSRHAYSTSTRPSVPQTRGAVVSTCSFDQCGKAVARLCRTCCCLRSRGPSRRPSRSPRSDAASRSPAPRLRQIRASVSPSNCHSRSRRPGSRSIRRLSELKTCRCGTVARSPAHSVPSHSGVWRRLYTGVRPPIKPAQAAAVANLGAGRSTIGTWINAANTPSATAIHHTAS